MIKSLPFLLILSLITICIEVDISAPSFPDISDYFNISEGLTQMTIGVNFFGFCLASVLYGPLSESFGRRSLMIYGNGLMLIGAVCCSFAPTIEWLLVARFIQGLGASSSAVLAFAMVADVYSGHKATKLIGAMNSILTVFMSIAPVAGSFINQIIGWRGNYSVVASISVISWLLLYFYLPETKKSYQKLSINRIFADYWILLFDKGFLYAALVPSLCYSGYMCFIACAPFLYMETFDLTITQYAIHQGVILSSFSITSMYAGWISNKVGQVNSIVYGVATSLISGIMIVIVAITSENAPYLTTLSMVIFAISSATYYPVVFARSMEIVPKLKGTASSFIMALRMLMCGAFVAVTGYLYNGTLLPVSLIIFISIVLLTVFTSKLLQLVSFAEDRV